MTWPRSSLSVYQNVGPTSWVGEAWELVKYGGKEAVAI